MSKSKHDNWSRMRRAMRFALLVAILTCVSACGSSSTSQAEYFRAFEEKADRGTGNGRLEVGAWEGPWSQTLNASLEASSLMHHKEPQIEQLCPGYQEKTELRRIFWQQLMVSLSWRESLHGPTNWIRFNGGVNDGLYQINPVLRTYYGCQGSDLFNPLHNIQCAMKMAKKLTDRHGSFLKGEKRGMASYWQPLRATNAYNRKNREFILNTVRNACRTKVIAYQRFKAGFVEEGEVDVNEADLSVNTIEDLGIDPSELEWPEEDQNRLQPNFMFDSASGIFLNL